MLPGGGQGSFDTRYGRVPPFYFIQNMPCLIRSRFFFFCFLYIGAVNAIQDAVILANCLYDIEDKSVKSLHAAFQSYYEQRYEVAKKAYNMSEVISKVMAGLTWQDRLARWLVMRIPQWVQQRDYEKQAAYRPQIMFLPQIGDRGMIPALPQKPSVRYLALQNKTPKAEASANTTEAVVV